MPRRQGQGASAAGEAARPENGFDVVMRDAENSCSSEGGGGNSAEGSGVKVGGVEAARALMWGMLMVDGRARGCEGETDDVGKWWGILHMEAGLQG